MADEGTLAELLSVERRGWDSLCNSTGSDFYGSIMTDDGLMVLAGGLTLDRDGVVDSLDSAPPWHHYEISEERVVPLCDDGAVLVYRAAAHRDGEEPFEATMSSVYVRASEGWRLALYQQSPVD